MLNFVICDDNLNIVARLSEMLELLFAKLDMDAKVAFTSDNAASILDYVNHHHVDVLILDINLNSSISGIELAQTIRKTNKNIYIIFSTGHLEYSLIAYSVKTFDYLPKPITMERLEVTLKRLMEDIKFADKEFLYIDKNTFINHADINLIKRDGMKVVFCTSNQEYETYSSFNKLQNILPDNFIRCHKSFIVNTNNISNINSSKNEIIFQDHSSCGIGPKYKNKVMEVFNYGNFTNNLDSINNRE